MNRTVLEQIRSLEKYLDKQLESARRVDDELREKFPDEAKDFDENEWFKRGCNSSLMRYKGVMEALLCMNPDVTINWDADGKHTICWFDMKADCFNCEHNCTDVCRKCRYHKSNEPTYTSYYKRVFNDGTVWDERKL